MSKISVGQCYEKDDHVYMVLNSYHADNNDIYWNLEDTLTRERVSWKPEFILALRRPFNNFG